MTPLIMTLIQDYLLAVADAVTRLQREFGADRVRRGPAGGQFARAGALSDGSEYQFHGIGCCVAIGDIDVDFDLGTDGRYDGFDAWRLWLFAKQQTNKYPAFRDQQSVDDAVRGLISDGKVVRSADPTDSLFYLAGSTMRRL